MLINEFDKKSTGNNCKDDIKDSLKRENGEMIKKEKYMPDSKSNYITEMQFGDDLNSNNNLKATAKAIIVLIMQ